MSDLLLDRVSALCRRHGLLLPGDSVLVAVSGGVDSMALLHVLLVLRAEWNLKLVVAHLDHGMRPSSAQDADFVKGQAEAMGLPFFQGRQDVPAHAQRTGQSLEAAARQLRLAFLGARAEAAGCGKVALGHHKNDQVETLLLHLLRGAGLRGLGGMRPKRGRWIRPLLDCTRDEIADWAAARDIAYRHDPSNDSPLFRRNALRHSVMPELLRHNPRFLDAAARAQALLRDAADYIDQQVKTAFQDVLAGCVEGRISLNRKRLCALDPVLQYGVVRQAFAQLADPLQLALSHVESVLDAAQGPTSGQAVSLPGGWAAVVTAQQLCMEKSAVVRHAPPPALLPVPGAARWRGWAIETRLFNVQPDDPCAFAEASGCLCARFDWGKISPPVVVRARLAGDRLRPLGMKGHKKIQDILVDAKVPRKQRDAVPVVADGQGILWVVGHHQDERTRLDTKTAKVLEIRATILEDGAIGS